MLCLSCPPAASAAPLPCQRSPALFQLAAHLLAMPAGAMGPDAFDVWSRRLQILSPGVRLYRAPRASGKGLRAWLRRLKRDSDAPLHCGLAQSKRGRAAVAVATAATASVAGRVLRFRLAPGFHRPRAVALTAAGGSAPLPLRRSAAGGYRLVAEPGWHLRLQVLAEGPQGLRPVLLWRRAPRRSLPWRAALAAWRQRLRPTRPGGLADRAAPPLRPNRLLTRQAKRHAARVCALGQARHGDDGRRQGPQSRLQQSALSARALGEVVIKVPHDVSPWREALLSPSHRATLLDPRFSDVGIGHSRDGQRRQRCIVVLLAAWPRVQTP
ncbi:MAG: CAP domain-containing protein [Polyangiales bacterium]